MRGLIITAVFFILLLSIIAVNILFVKNTTEAMKSSVNSLNSIPCENNSIKIDNIKSEWDKKSVWLSLSVSYDNIKEITDMIDAVKAANDTGNAEQLKIYIKLLLNSIEEIGRLESFSIKNILKNNSPRELFFSIFFFVLR